VVPRCPGVYENLFAARMGAHVRMYGLGTKGPEPRACVVCVIRFSLVCGRRTAEVRVTANLGADARFPVSRQTRDLREIREWFRVKQAIMPP